MLTEYLQLLNEKKYEEMYDYLSEEAQAVTDKETYVNRYQNIYGGIQASDIRVNIRESEKEKGGKKGETRRVLYTLTMDTVAGELSFDTVALFTEDEEGAYKMNWDSQDIFPNLYNTDKVSVKITRAKRGIIYDRNQVELAREGVASSVGLVPGKLPEDREGAIEQLAGLLEISTEKIEKALSAGWVREDTFVPLRTVAKDASDLKKQLLEIPGVMITDTMVRYYPFGEKTAHLLGYVQNITAEELEKRSGQGYNQNSIIGKAGAERTYEEQLRPRDGYSIRILDENGDVKDIVLEKPAQDGQNVNLTIDITLQQYLYQELQEDKACAVAMDPTTGELLALVSTPAYDSNDFVMGYTSSAWKALNEDEKRPLENRYQSAWEQGRTPLELCTRYTALLNHGDTLEPQLLLGAEKKIQKEQVFSEEEAEQLLTEMYQNVEEPGGSVHEAERKNWRMAGITGSASMSGGRDLGWFTGLSAENTDRPLLLTVMIEDVKERGGSSYVISRGMKGFDVYRNEDGQ